jgi:hypothetical protein
MRDFFDDYISIPLSILLLFFIAPTAVFGGLKLAQTLFDVAPACEVRK